MGANVAIFLKKSHLFGMDIAKVGGTPKKIYTFAAHLRVIHPSVPRFKAARMVESVDTKDLKSFGQ